MRLGPVRDAALDRRHLGAAGAGDPDRCARQRCRPAGGAGGGLDLLHPPAADGVFVASAAAAAGHAALDADPGKPLCRPDGLDPEPAQSPRVEREDRQAFYFWLANLTILLSLVGCAIGWFLAGRLPRPLDIALLMLTPISFLLSTEKTAKGLDGKLAFGSASHCCRSCMQSLRCSAWPNGIS